jgi:hypothetical protein
MKGAGLYESKKDEHGIHRLKILDTEYEFPPDYRFVLDGKRRSPWYDNECSKRGSMQEIAQNLDIDYLKSGSMFFDSAPFARIRSSGDLREPDVLGNLSFDVTTGDSGTVDGVGKSSIKWIEHPEGRIALWTPLENNRPSQMRNYVGFCDISMGSGASNSVCTILDVDDREQVCQFVTPEMPPQDFATYCVALWHWFGGQVGFVFAGWEENGPGVEFRLQVMRLRYPYFYRRRQEGNVGRRKTKTIGWHSNQKDKRIILGELRGAMSRNEITIHCKETIREAEQYINYDNGGIGPSELVEETTGARSAHGDRVIALAGANLMLKEQARVKLPAFRPPEGSYADRRRQYEKKLAKVNQW